ncbi:MAG: hypothetical protein IPM11_08045 [Micropruina sp.]|nr:hypothetical protein [Micropruina sp.]
MANGAWSSANRRSRMKARGGRSLGPLVVAAFIEVVLIVAEILIVALHGREASQGIFWALAYWIIFVSLVPSVLGLVGFALTRVDLAAARITHVQGRRRRVTGAVLFLLAPLTVNVGPLLAWIGFGPP